MFFCVQSNLSTTTTIGTWKKLSLCRELSEKHQWQVILVIDALGQPLLTGGHCSEVVINRGLTVYYSAY